MFRGQLSLTRNYREKHGPVRTTELRNKTTELYTRCWYGNFGAIGGEERGGGERGASPTPLFSTQTQTTGRLISEINPIRSWNEVLTSAGEDFIP